MYENYNYKQLKTLRSKKLSKLTKLKEKIHEGDKHAQEIRDITLIEIEQIDQRLKELGD